MIVLYCIIGWFVLCAIVGIAQLVLQFWLMIKAGKYLGGKQ